MPSQSLPRFVLWPAVITLAVTALRLVGELQQWSPRFFNRDAGGGAALVGIVWLIPVFGAYFAVRLCRAGKGPPHLGAAFGWALLAVAVNGGLGFLTFTKVASPVTQLAVFALTSCLAIAIAIPAWPALWRALMAYGLAARLPVVAIMYFAILGSWDTHFAKPRPDFPAMSPLATFLWTGLLPQMSIWIFLTVVLGLIFGALAAAVARVVDRPAGQ